MHVRQMLRWPLAAAAIALVAGCSDDEKDDTSDDGSITFGDDTDVDDPSASSGWARVMNAFTDVAAIDVTVGDESKPLLTDIPAGTATDDDDYAAFPPGLYTVSSTNSADDAPLSKVENEEVALNTFYTVLFYGSLAAPAAAPLTDDVSKAAAGSHRLTVYNLDPSAGPFDVWVAKAEVAPGVAYGTGSAPLTVSSGAVTVDLDLDADDVVDRSFALDLADTGWSYAYVVPTADGLSHQVYHHVRSAVVQTVASN